MTRMRVIPLLFAAGLSVACTKVDRDTQVTLGLSSEAEIPRELDAFTLRVLATRTGELRFAQEYFPQSGREFPTTLAVIPQDEDSIESPLRVEIEGGKGATVFLKRQAVVSYVEGRNVLLNMPLRMACFQFKDCGPNKTCAGGRCVEAEVQAAALRDYQAALVFPSANRCFDEEACLAESAPVAVADDCSFSIAGAGDNQGNVAIRWDAAPERLLALDSGDPQEGWSRTAPDRGQLAAGLCDSYFRRRGNDGELLVPDWARKVYFAPRCASKTAAVPYCFSNKTQHAGIGAMVPESVP